MRWVVHTRKQGGYQAASCAFDLAFDLAFDSAFDLRRPVKPRWPEFDIEAWGKSVLLTFDWAGILAFKSEAP